MAMIPAMRHHDGPIEGLCAGIRATEWVYLHAPPVAEVSEVESVMGLWWFRAGGYPVGQVFATFGKGTW